MFDSTVVVLELHGLPACAMRTYDQTAFSSFHKEMFLVYTDSLFQVTVCANLNVVL